jgi:hypothetical protein
MSVLPLKADIRQREWHVRYVPRADVHLKPAFSEPAFSHVSAEARRN